MCCQVRKEILAQIECEVGIEDFVAVSIMHKLVDSVLLPLLESTAFLLTIGSVVYHINFLLVPWYHRLPPYHWVRYQHQKPHQRFLLPALYTAATLLSNQIIFIFLIL